MPRAEARSCISWIATPASAAAREMEIFWWRYLSRARSIRSRRTPSRSALRAISDRLMCRMVARPSNSPSSSSSTRTCRLGILQCNDLPCILRLWHRAAHRPPRCVDPRVGRQDGAGRTDHRAETRIPPDETLEARNPRRIPLSCGYGTTRAVESIPDESTTTPVHPVPSRAGIDPGAHPHVVPRQAAPGVQPLGTLPSESSRWPAARPCFVPSRWDGSDLRRGGSGHVPSQTEAHGCGTA